MNQVDAAVLVILGLAAVRGYVRGVLRESFGVVGLVGGIIAGLGFSQQLGDVLIDRGILKPVEVPFVAAPAIFIGVYFLATLLGVIARKLAQALLLGGVDRAGGVLFGIAKGAALCGLVLALAQHVLPKGYVQVVDDSKLGTPLATLGMRIVDAGRQISPEAQGSPI